MELRVHGLHIELFPVSRASAEDWARVRVLAHVNGFEGDFEAWIQPAALMRFAKELAVLCQSVGKPGTALLASVEPDVEVRLTMQPLGGITGLYSLESERRAGVPTVLSGAFELDQSFIPQLQQSVEALAESLQAQNVP